MNIRSFALATVALAVMAPAAFAGSVKDDGCVYRDKNNNGGMICMQKTNDMAGQSYGLIVQADDQGKKTPVHLFDTWPGKSTR